MKENTRNEEKTWIKYFNGLSFGYKLKAKEAIFTLLTTAVDLAMAVPLSLTFVPENDIEKEESIASMLSSFRKSTYYLRDSVKESVSKMIKDSCGDKQYTQVQELFSSNKEKTIYDLFNFELNTDLKKRVEDLLIACMPQTYKKNHIPDDTTLDYRVYIYD